MANPRNAAAMVAVANALAPPEIGRVLLLRVISAERYDASSDDAGPLLEAQAVLAEALHASLAAGYRPEALTTIAPRIWTEIRRVAGIHHCESLLLGLSELSDDGAALPIGELMSDVACDVVVLRAAPGWRLSEVRRVLVPIGGRGGHDELRSRLLGSLLRTGSREVTFLRVLPAGATETQLNAARRDLGRIAQDEAPGRSRVVVAAPDAVAQRVVEEAVDSDLVVLGLMRFDRRHKAFGDFTLRVAHDTPCPLVMISRRG